MFPLNHERTMSHIMLLATFEMLRLLLLAGATAAVVSHPRDLLQVDCLCAQEGLSSKDTLAKPRRSVETFECLVKRHCQVPS